MQWDKLEEERQVNWRVVGVVRYARLSCLHIITEECVRHDTDSLFLLGIVLFNFIKRLQSIKLAFFYMLSTPPLTHKHTLHTYT